MGIETIGQSIALLLAAIIYTCVGITAIGAWKEWKK